jgi:hypothetical protein
MEGLEYITLNSVNPTVWVKVADGLGCGVCTWACVEPNASISNVKKKCLIIDGLNYTHQYYDFIKKKA